MNEFSPWQQRAYDHAVAALDSGRMGHALLVCGPAGLGQQEVVARLALHVLAKGDRGDRARAQQLIAAGTHPDLQLVSFIPNKEGTRLRSEIVIEQIRGLSQKLALTPQYGEAQVAIVDPADAINNAASNALLKTLEEPAPGRYLWLLSAQPARLSATIRSRCQKLEFRLPPHAEALAWLQAQGHAPALASEALEAARGHPGIALDWLQNDGLALRRQVAEDLQKLERGEMGANETAQRWAADEQLHARLSHAADIVLAWAGETGLTNPSRLNKLSAWFDAANRTRDLLRTTIRADLAVADLLLGWVMADRTASRGRARKQGE
ncbi:DNA polymerase III subunit delta' [Pseudoxanthomonas dokdonensis]|uniref:DNA-directed DNA polymerase n=1 Tax=Pseudoxanthomonas dokdonensis TaxID=344882 RepID=A0A0R0CLG3_9GAMM|nr:DNA polymerase III subunit delta' [Pseudoxanthomonas dokdonensis]KRG70861.1 DNA polymerase III subunit delta' [Pseudoxanthomonas dokdonensis]